jgi:hypothetical protein
MLAGCTAAQTCRRDAPPAAGSEFKKVSQGGPSFTCPAGLIAARRGGSDPDRYRAPSPEERAALTRLVASLVSGDSRISAPARTDAAALGFRIEPVPEMAGVVLLSERGDQRRGGGAYLFRPGAPSRVVVQAPHTLFDEGTLPLGCELFDRATALAFFIDTAHRYKAADIDDAGNHPADVAHSPETLFQAATEGLLRAAPGVTVVQIHGFGPRESGAAVVLSSGIARSGDELEKRAQELLAAVVSGRVARFPDDTSELGATTNVQGGLVRASGGRFLHVEIAADVRQRLLADTDLRASFLDALVRSFAAP